MLLVYLTWCISVAFAVSLKDYETASNASLLWGPYRSNLYLGIRPRIPDSLLTGLFWFSGDNYESIMKAKHTCEQNDDFAKFSWTKYDPRLGGTEIIKDRENNLDLRFDFVKSYNLRDAAESSWGLRVRGVPKGNPNAVTGIVFYAGLEITLPEEEVITIVEVQENGYGHDQIIHLVGWSKDFRKFTIKINDGPATNTHPTYNGELPGPEYDPSTTKHFLLNTPADSIWRAKEIFVTLLQDSLEKISLSFDLGASKADLNKLPPYVGLTLPDLNKYQGNLHFVEKLFVGSFEFDVVFESEESTDQGYQPVTFDNIAGKIKLAVRGFQDKFKNTFEFAAPYTSKAYRTFGQELISNIIGGIGYFHGDQMVDRDANLDEEDHGRVIALNGKAEGPASLFTCVPSRPFFPRGFYWDEGFHLIPVLEYDFGLALEVLQSWFSLIDDDGWIAREQILGAEARSKVPAEFTVQNPNIANPPTLMLVFVDILKKAHQAATPDLDTPESEQVFQGIHSIKLDDLQSFHLKDSQYLIDYAKKIYPKLVTHYNWWRRTQQGQLQEFERLAFSPVEAYRWAGRTEHLCLPSGLDDYPRSDYPDVSELHVDAISWVGSFTRSMKQLAEFLDYKDDAKKYADIEEAIVRNIDDLHWSEKHQSYCDVTLDDDDEDEFVCHDGYITLFPVILKLVPHTSPHVLAILKMIADPEKLFSPYGIRSLSKASEHYRNGGDDYWRGKIWMNINYLVLDALIHYSQPDLQGNTVDQETRELISDLYSSLRVNVVNNVYNQHKSTGYVWENYDDRTGQPTGARLFLGWTGLIVMIMKMPETI